jgi:pterin-4a-carbinolamine dehydratase
LARLSQRSRRSPVGDGLSTNVLPPGVGQAFRDRIARVEQAMNHHAVIAERPDGTTYRVWTHARGVVTHLDVELGRRISEIVEES